MSRPAFDRVRAPVGVQWTAALTSVGVLMTLLIPAPLLDLLGVGYSTPTGAAWEKVHPGSDLILLGFLVAVVTNDRPLAFVADAVRRFPGAVVFLTTILFLTLYIILVQHAPFTPLIDTFLVPVFLFVVLSDLDERWARRVEAGLHVFVAVNAVLGITEYLTGWRLIPVVLAGIDQTSEVEERAFGLLGHPLASAAMAGLYAIVVACGGGRRLPAPWRTPAIGLQLAALVAFGGRTALVLTFVCLAGAILISLLRFLGGQRLDLRIVGIGLMLSPLLVALLVSLANAGFFDVILGRFVEDNGSAKSREIIFELFGYMSWQDLMLGPNLQHLDSLQHLLGIEIGVESFWLGFLFDYGLLPSLVFFVGLACFTAHVMQQTQVQAWIPLLYFIGIISTSISLSAKSTSLTQFIVTLMVLMPATPRTALVPRRGNQAIPVWQ